MEEKYGSATYKERAIRFLQGWLNELLKDLEEPKRVGTARGEKIGMGKQKIMGAGLLILHPTLPMHEISRIAGVSSGVLRKWKTEEAFKDMMQVFAENFGTYLAKLLVAMRVEEYLGLYNAAPRGGLSVADSDNKACGLESRELLSWCEIGDDVLVLKSEETSFNSFLNTSEGIEIKNKKIHFIDDGPGRWTIEFYRPDKYSSSAITDGILPLLPWYAGAAGGFATFIKENLHIPGVSVSLMIVYKAAFFWRDASEARKRAWKTRPEMLELWQDAMISCVEDLRDNQSRGKSERHEIAGMLIESIKEISELLKPVNVRG